MYEFSWGKDLIQEQWISRIKGLIKQYYEMRKEVQLLQVEGKQLVKQFLEDPKISEFMTTEMSKSSEWNAFLANQRSDLSHEPPTLSQLESALNAKWKRCPLQIVSDISRISSNA